METKTTTIEVVDFCRQHGFSAELVGQWVWVTFAEKPEQDLLKKLKLMGFKWSRRRGKWACNCGHPTKSAYESSPFDKYHCRAVSGPNSN